MCIKPIFGSERDNNDFKYTNSLEYIVSRELDPEKRSVAMKIFAVEIAKKIASLIFELTHNEDNTLLADAVACNVLLDRYESNIVTNPIIRYDDDIKKYDEFMDESDNMSLIRKLSTYQRLFLTIDDTFSVIENTSPDDRIILNMDKAKNDLTKFIDELIDETFICLLCIYRRFDESFFKDVYHKMCLVNIYI